RRFIAGRSSTFVGVRGLRGLAGVPGDSVCITSICFGGLMTESEAEMTEEEKQYPLEPSLLDVAVYRDPARYRQELEQVFLTGWCPAAPSCDLVEPGDQVVWEQLEQSVVLARTEDGSVSARHDVRQRRDTELAAGSDRRGPGTVYNMRDRGTNAPVRPS